MNWITLLLRALQLAPVIVAGIEHIHGEAPGATKKQMAMDALALASGSASALDPGDQPAIDAATQLTSNVIDNTVAVFNAAGLFGKRGSAPKPLPIAPSPAPDLVTHSTVGLSNRSTAPVTAQPDAAPAAASDPAAALNRGD